MESETEQILVRCSCGKKFRVRKRTDNAVVLCPGCNKSIQLTPSTVVEKVRPHWSFNLVWAAWALPACIAVGGILLVVAMELWREPPAPNPNIVEETNVLSPSNEVAAEREKGIVHFENVHKYEEHEDFILTIDLFENRLLSASHDGHVYLWDVDTHERIGDFVADGDQFWGVAWAPDGKSFACSGKTGKVYFVTPDCELIQALDASTTTIRTIAYSPDGANLFAGGVDHRVTVWDVATGTLAKSLKTPHGIWELCITKDLIAAALADHTLKTWSADSFEEDLRVPHKFFN